MSIVEGSTCKSCRKFYKIDLLIPDHLWKLIQPKQEEKLCGSCIMQRLEQALSFDVFNLTPQK